MPSSFSNRRSAILSATHNPIGQELSLGFNMKEMSPSMVEEFCMRSRRATL
jgi:hypothetical protein